MMLLSSGREWRESYGAVMSRTHEPPDAENVTIASSPVVELIGVNDSKNPLLKTYSGLLADSVAPDGETVSVNDPLFSKS
jgi:hypothetical protein